MTCFRIRFPHQSCAVWPRRLCIAQCDREGTAPWTITAYITKKKERTTDELGRIITPYESLAEPIGWTRETQAQLAFKIVADDAGVTPEYVAAQVEALHVVLPSLGKRFSLMTPGAVARMALQLDDIVQRLLELRDIFPTADLGAIASGFPQVLFMPIDDIHTAAHQVAERLGQPGSFDALVEQIPQLLDLETADGVLSELERLFGVSGSSAAALLRNDPTLFSSLEPLKNQSRGDRDADYLAYMFQPRSRSSRKQ